MLKTGERQLYETEFHAPDGSVIYYESEAVQWRLNDVVLGVIIVARDITTRKKLIIGLAWSEEQFSQLADLAPIGIYLSDLEGNCTYANKTLLDMAGLTMDEASGIGWQSVLHPDDRDAVAESWQKAVI